MSFLDALSQHLIAEEGLRLDPYRCTEGKLTIGVGRCIDTNPLTAQERSSIGHDCTQQAITNSQAMLLLDNDILKVMKQLDLTLPWWDQLTEARQIALCSMVFQMGITGVLKFKKALKALELGHYADAAAEFCDSLWAQQTPHRAKRIAHMIETGEA